MTDIPVISIVTPSFNQGNFIEETIISVISQEGNFYLEYFIMDGGSTDQTVEIMKKYDNLLKDGKWPLKCKGIQYKWVSEKDKGQSDAINKGLLKASGDIIGWINSDDFYFPNTFSVVMKHFIEYPEYDFIYGDGDVINNNGDIQWEWRSRAYDFEVLKSYNFCENQFNNYIMQQATFWRRRVHDHIGLLDITLHYAMDYEYWIRAGAKGLRMHHLPFKFGTFRMIEGTKSLSSPLVFWPDAMEIFRRYNGATAMKPFLEQYYFNKGIHNGFNISRIYDIQDEIFQRWKGLPDDEWNILKVDAERAFEVACLMLANKVISTGDIKKAQLFYQYAVAKRFSLYFHPLAIRYYLRKILVLKILCNRKAKNNI